MRRPIHDRPAQTNCGPATTRRDAGVMLQAADENRAAARKDRGYGWQKPAGKFIQHPSNGLWEQDGMATAQMQGRSTPSPAQWRREMKLSEKFKRALREQQEINLSDPAVQKRLAAQWGMYLHEAQPAPSVPTALAGRSQAVADGLDGYEKRSNVGNVTGRVMTIWNPQLPMRSVHSRHARESSTGGQTMTLSDERVRAFASAIRRTREVPADSHGMGSAFRMRPKSVPLTAGCELLTEPSHVTAHINVANARRYIQEASQGQARQPNQVSRRRGNRSRCKWGVQAHAGWLGSKPTYR